MLCTVYIPPNSDSDYLNSLLLYFSNLIISHDRIILVGDFNLPDVDWDTLTGTSLSSKSFCDFVFQNNLSQLIHTHTHLKGNILDIVLTNSDELISNVEVTPPCHSLSSDHYIIYSTVVIQISIFQRKT